MMRLPTAFRFHSFLRRRHLWTIILIYKLRYDGLFHDAERRRERKRKEERDKGE